MRFTNIIFLLLSSYFLIQTSFAETVIVKFYSNFDHKLTSKTLGEWSKFTTYKSKYFSSLYIFKSPNKLTQKDLDFIKSFKSVESIERLTEVKASTIGVRNVLNSKYPSDPLSIYQWGLDFQNQDVGNEQNDLKEIIIKGTKTSDIGITNLDELDLKFKKNTLVAVIDTGVDYRHPDLKNSIFINEVECENGEIPFDPAESNDGNEFAGDCKGWNFTGRKKNGNNRPDDSVGHGTHVAGIIAATRNNGIGISGLSNNIKILPIKVLTDKKQDSQAIGTSDRLSRAILYAVQMKADVINLSLGWPLAFDKGHLRNAVLEAVRKGVTVVAAAGNNDHSDPIMPCGYPGVICVGASDPDERVSDFSNYGAHVDVLAPGNNIFSTFPTANNSSYTDSNGYDIKSGTSQAAPYVTALVATLKGIYPGISEDEVKARIYGSTKAPYIDKATNKFVNGNIINFDKALSFDKGILKPIFKGFNRVKVYREGRQFEFTVNFDSYGTVPGDARISVSASSDILLTDSNFYLDSSRKEITVKGSLKDLDINSLQKFSISLVLNGEVAVYAFEKRFYMDFAELKGIKKYKIVGGNPRTVTKLSTLNYMHHPYNFPFYYTNQRSEGSLLFTLFTKVDTKIKALGTVRLQKVKKLLSVHRLDANLDGVADILVRTLIERDKEGGSVTVDEDGNEVKEQEKTVMFSYFTENMKPLFLTTKIINGKEITINHSNMILDFEGVILQNLNDFSFGKVSFGSYGKILVPVYMTFGDLPQEDTNKNPFARLRRRAFSAKIFYYEPVVNDDGSVSLITRSFNNNKFVDQLKKKINFRPFEQIFMLKFSKQSFEDIKAGRFSILISHESERKLPKNYTLKITDIENRKWTIKRNQGENLNLSSFKIKGGFDLTKKNLFKHEIETKLVGSEKSSRLSWEEFTIENERAEYVSIIQKNVLDSLEYPIKTYFSKDKTYRIFATPSRIFMETTWSDGRKKSLSFPVHISSFLPGMLFKEQHYPISFFESGVHLPALYVDSTQIASRNIYVMIAKEDKIYAPVRFNVNIPEQCKPLNPVIIEGYKYEYSIQCFKKDKSSELIYVPLETE